MATVAEVRAARLAALPFIDSTPPSRSLIPGFAYAVADLARHRELLGLVVRRELKAKYKDSSLGFLWTLIKPLTLLLIYYVAIGQFLGAARSIAEFGIFVYAGITIWGLYNETVFGGTNSIVQNSGLVKKVYFPREIFPLAAAGSAIINFAIQLGILLISTLILGEFPASWSLLYAVPAIIIVLLYSMATALILSAVNVYLRDIQYLIEVALMVAFWASPIIYAWSFVAKSAEGAHSWLIQVYLLNPITMAILAFQRATWVAGSETRTLGASATGVGVDVPPQPWPVDLNLRLAIVAVVGIVFLAVAQRIFARLQGNFAQEL